MTRETEHKPKIVWVKETNEYVCGHCFPDVKGFPLTAWNTRAK